jgi:hypothetical protein
MATVTATFTSSLAIKVTSSLSGRLTATLTRSGAKVASLSRALASPTTNFVLAVPKPSREPGTYVLMLIATSGSLHATHIYRIKLAG